MLSCKSALFDIHHWVTNGIRPACNKYHLIRNWGPSCTCVSAYKYV